MAYIHYYTPAGGKIKAKRIDTGKEYTFSGQGSFDTNQYQIISGQEFTSPSPLSAPPSQQQTPTPPPTTSPYTLKPGELPPGAVRDPSSGKIYYPGGLSTTTPQPPTSPPTQKYQFYDKEGRSHGFTGTASDAYKWAAQAGYTTQPPQPTQPKSTYTGPSIVDYLKSVGKPSSFSERAKLAKQYGITNYSGTAAQNTQLLNILRGGTTPTTQQPVTFQVSQPGATYDWSKAKEGLYDLDVSAPPTAASTPSYVQPTQTISQQLEAARQQALEIQRQLALKAQQAQAATGESYPTNLYQYYTQQGKSLPSITERAGLYQQAGLGPATSYIGTAKQNTALLNYLLNKTPAGAEGTTEIPEQLTPSETSVAVTAEKIGEEKEGETPPPDVNKIIDEETAYYTSIKNLQDLKESLGIDETEAPTPPNLEAAYSTLRSQYGVDAIETQLNDLNKLIRDKEASLRQGLYTQEGRLAPMELIGTRQRELMRQGQEELDALNREKAVLVEEYNTKQNLINNLMTLKKTDYATTKDAYDTAFTQNLQLQQLLATTQNAAQDNARANLTILANLVKDAETATGELPSTFKLQLNKLEMQTGIPVGTIEYFSKAKPDAELIAHGTATDADGKQFVYMMYKDPKTGAIKTSNVYTGGVGSTTRGGTFKFTSSQTSKLLSLGLTNEEIKALASDISNQGVETALSGQTGLTTAQKNGIKNILAGTKMSTTMEEYLAQLEATFNQYKSAGYSRKEVERQWQRENETDTTPDQVKALLDKVFADEPRKATLWEKLFGIRSWFE